MKIRLGLRFMGSVAMATLWLLAVSGVAQAQPSEDAGYFTNGLSPLSASATYVVPSFTCTGKQDDAIVVNVNWTALSTDMGFASVSIDCASAGARPTFASTVYAGGTDFVAGPSVKPGDTITVSISGSSTGSSSKLTDDTTGKKAKVRGMPQTGKGINARFVLERELDTTPSFTKLTFQAMTVDGAPLTSSTANAAHMMSSVVQAHARPISSANGVIVFKHS
jgi:hypothetical protein